MPTEISVSVSAPSTGIFGKPYFGTVTATGGVPPYHWTAVQGLPPGITASVSGATITLSGTLGLGSQGPWYVYGQATDSYVPTPQPGGWSINLTVSYPNITVSCDTPPTATNGQPYSGTVIATEGDGIPFIWSNFGLPAGLTGTANNLTYTISGTPDVTFTGSPPVAQSYDMEFTVTDDHSAASIDCPVLISPG
jgi:hypothetical protein